MESFKWSPSFLTGMVDVDIQHHRLVDMINRFGEMLADSMKAGQQEVEALLVELEEYAAYHFAEEEKIMRDKGVHSRFVEFHCRAHQEYIAEVVKMHGAVVEGDVKARGYLLSFLTNWLVAHILGCDQHLSRQISAIECGMSPAEAFEKTKIATDPSTETLLQALNELFERLSIRNRELFELNEELEERVALRTRELSEANRRLEEMAMTDILTGLPNRRYAMQVFEEKWTAGALDGSSLACMLIDADHFKTINDTYGHEAGDAVLRALSRQLNYSVRSDDVVCRLGGDEFLIICDRTDLEGAMTLAEKVRKEVNALRVPAGEGEWLGSISVGVAARQPGMKIIEDLIKLADEGVYISKRHGRNWVATACERTS